MELLKYNRKENLNNKLVIRKVKYEDIEQIVDINIKDWKKVYKGIIDDEILDNLNREEKIKNGENITI